MKQLNDEEIKKEGVRILLNVHKYCLENNIRYSLFYGSLLGAIRHEGYIPWDDDIDIAMPREDYERFIKEYDNDDFGVMTCYNNKYYYLPYAKVYSKNTIKFEHIRTHKKYSIGFNIDIFPLDVFSSLDNYHAAKKKEEWLLKKMTFSILPEKITSFKVFLAAVIGIPLWLTRGYNRYAKKLDKFFINYDRKNIKKEFYVGNETNGFNTELVFDKHLFDNLILKTFEGHKFFVTDKYDSALKQRYGDYMKMPPEEQRVSNHSFKAYYK